ncbi:RagB/SusD family nutrient uptake outer membrane protein [Chitinophaga sp.]|uniref:RagB/SusD family nutrient uptake outer membrane protein n=1 Tax=Chitinophaga sp. TaxID=1869181 RepID=UPI002F95E542
MKNSNYISILVLAVGLLTGCSKVLDKSNLTAVNPDQVWSNEAIGKAYLDNIYAAMMPGNPYGSANGTDEGVPYQKQTDAWMQGSATYDSYDIYGSQYSNIRTINILLENIDQASFAPASKNQMKGQALFWRAWAYYALTKSYGGVPLITAPQAVSVDLNTLQVPRNTTTECIAQITKDLDDAIALLPDVWTGEDVGRIDKCAAMAFKGRVLLFFASPLFNPSGAAAKWQQAYDACQAAKNECDAQGKGL